CPEAASDRCATQIVPRGVCDELPRWRWTIAGCRAVECPSACVDPECERLSPTRSACEADHRGCEVESSCEEGSRPAEVDRACVADLRVPRWSRSSVEIEVFRSRCDCATMLGCAARVVAPFQLELEATLCTHGGLDCDCDPSGPYDIHQSCLLPPLGEGVWTLRGLGLAPITIESIGPWEMRDGFEPVCFDR
ncbi:MAG: hypothetical protein OEY14_12910, partial [Myxococcales bacterium]|nr:hypothetical protein [Myxococcales bacterium]